MLRVAELMATRLPQPARRFADWPNRTDATGWIRQRFTLIVAAGSLAVATGLSREDGFGPLLFSETLWFAGGVYAFGMTANAALGPAAHQPRGRRRQALHAAAVAEAAALPISLGLRRSILALPA
jgi:hypothetical protein